MAFGMCGLIREVITRYYRLVTLFQNVENSGVNSDATGQSYASVAASK